ncbi:MAG: hypothetical protein H0W83_04675, partial [Planctomycetes bacterium]|nr:hypothetical protein [Planctomycetota bacterium]
MTIIGTQSSDSVSGRRDVRTQGRRSWICLIIGMLLLGGAVSTDAATATWTGGGSDTNVSTAANWGGTAPTSSDDVVIASGSALIIWDASAPGTVNSISLNSGFTGSVTLKKAISTSAGLTVNAGTLYTDKDAATAITVTGTFSIGASGTVIVRRSSTASNGAGQTITAGTLTITGSLNSDGEGFADNAGPGHGTYNAGGTHGGDGDWNT